MSKNNILDLAHQMKVLNGKTILITGGTGSFGTAFIKALLQYGQPNKVIVLSRDEQKHYKLSQEIQDRRLRFFIGDIRDKARLKSSFRGAQIVIHAAAMKHVPMCEYNPLEAVQTNITGATNVIEAALEAGVERVLAISTDKAVAPVNLYGASKLCMERLWLAANAYVGDRPTRFAAVRYGNVMGSAGSVIPLFKKQKELGKITVTDENMTRFWIRMDDAISLVLRALKLMQGGEVFIPKLPTTTIATLAEAVAPGVPVETIGMRPGEKLHECLISSEECRRTVDLGDVLMIRPEFDFGGFFVNPHGTPVPDDFYYASDRPDLCLSVEEATALLGTA
jgi:UDP-N-acetylglucosamine 4,6-dehydratase/5-epimerase